jgi:polysaccharide pyruvyl transferase CsaB
LKKRRVNSSVKPKVILVGYYGAGNIGDEAILYSMLNRLRSHLDILVLGYGYNTKKNDLGIKYGLLPRYNRPSEILKFLKRIAHTDALIFGGGGYFASKLQPRTFYYWLFLAIVAKIFRKKLIFFAASVGPFKKGITSLLAKFILNRADAIILRDSTSERFIKELGVRNTTKVISDIVFLLESTNSDKDIFLNSNMDSSSPKVLFVMPIRYQIKEIWKNEKYRTKYIRYVQSISHLADFVVDQLNGTPIFLPFESGDIKMYLEIISSMKRKEHAVLYDKINYDNIDLDFILNIIKHCNFVVGGRYHSTVFSIIAGIPVIPVVYHPKLYDLVTRFDMKEMYLENGDGIEWPDVDIDVEKAMSIFLKINAQRNLPEPIKSKYLEMKQKAEEGIQTLLSVIQS